MGETNKEVLVERLHHQRSQMSSSRDSLRSELSLTYQLKESLRSHPKRWLVGGAASAFVISSLLRRKKVIYSGRQRKRGLIRRTIRVAYFFARPTLTAFAIQQARNYAEDRLGPLPDDSMLGDPLQK